MEHELDYVTAWCLRCGCGVVHYLAVPEGLACTRAENVVAVSHIVRSKPFRRLVALTDRYG